MFDNRKIVDAILKAMGVTEEGEDIVLAAEIAAAISNAQLQMYPQWGHGLYEEEKEFNQGVLSFLKA